jgi:hypothetical protein
MIVYSPCGEPGCSVISQAQPADWTGAYCFGQSRLKPCVLSLTRTPRRQRKHAPRQLAWFV